jgi:hypothetical protein
MGQACCRGTTLKSSGDDPFLGVFLQGNLIEAVSIATTYGAGVKQGEKHK